VLALLAQAGPDDAPVSRLLELMSIYVDAHWGDRARPPVDWGGGPLVARVAARASEPVATAGGRGARPGRGVPGLARGAELTVGVDSSLASLRRARRLVAGEGLRYARRAAGRFYAPATVDSQISGAESGAVVWICADALDPPFAPSSFDRVAALNL